MNIIQYRMDKFSDFSDLGYMKVIYKSVECQKDINSTFELKIPIKKYHRQDGLMKVFGTMEEIYDFYHN